MVAHGQPVPPELQAKFDAGRRAAFQNVRAVFGGRIQHAVSGAAPIAPEILEFFYGCGVPVLEGYGMTETSTVSTYSTVEEHRFGSVGELLPGVEGPHRRGRRAAPQGRRTSSAATTRTTTRASAR